jgi:glycosyltransferase involved in cell wall biosynthesis
MGLPSVACICMTYGRTACLEEAIQFFLAQDYEGPKELVVVNDLAEQELVFEHPEVRVYNHRTRFENLGKKRDYAIRRSRGEVILTWDDDDGYLPSHIRACVRLLGDHDYVKPDKCLVWVGASTIERIAGSFLAQIVFTRGLYERAGGYAGRSYGEDSDLSARMLAIPGVKARFASIADEDVTFLFRWANGEYHLSGYGSDGQGQAGYAKVAADVHGQVRAGRVRSGAVRLSPSFRHDYAEMVRSFLHPAPSGVPATLLTRTSQVAEKRLLDADLPPPWSVSMWVTRPEGVTEPLALFDSGDHSIRLAQYGHLSRFGVTKYRHQDWTFDFCPEPGALTHVALVAEPRSIALFVDGQRRGALLAGISFPRSVADARSLVEYRVYTGALTEAQIGELAGERPLVAERRIRLKFTTNWIGDADFVRYLAKMTKGDLRWGSLEIVTEGEDYTVVVNHPRGELTLDPERTIHLHMEPACVRRGWGRWHEPDGATAQIAFHERNTLEWHLSLDYEALSRARPDKSRILSAVVSDLHHMEGHRLRLDFVRNQLSRLPYFDHWGKGEHRHGSYRGQLARKEDGLFPYAYTFAAENCAEPGYFTEKIADAILSECLTFYWGCPDLERWIHPDCFIRLDLRDPEGALAVVQRAIEGREQERRLDTIRREKSRILDELQIFPTLERLLVARGRPSPPTHPARQDPALPRAPAETATIAAPKRAGRGEVWVAGFPSAYGGADTELDHLIDLLRDQDVEVNLVPMFGADEAMKRSVLARGCRIHAYRDDVFRGRTVVSYCNGNFLDKLPAIMSAGRPAKVVWFNCMTSLFEGEKRAHRDGLIDYFGFVSDYQRRMLGPRLAEIRPFQSFPYRPYFNARRAEWRYRDWHGSYNVGRISRDDGDKFATDTWRIFDRVLVPSTLEKKVYILGYGPNAARKIGSAPPGLSCRTWTGNEVPATELYRTVDTMIHKTGGSRESYCRVLVEAYAHGVVPIVEDDFAFSELVVHGETGFAAKSSDEMSYYASVLAHDPATHRRIAEEGRRFLEEKLVSREACWRGWQEIL